MHSLDPRVVNLWRLQGVLAIFTSLAPLLFGLGAALTFQFGIASAFMVVPTLVVLLFVRALIWPSLRFRGFRYSLDDQQLIVEQGVLFRETIAVPRSRIQHVDTRQGPLERLVGVSRLLVYTGAGLSADGSLPGLDEAEAVRLRGVLAATSSLHDDGV